MKGNITMTGYWPDSPDKDNDFNIIPSNNITMDRVKKPLLGISNTGDKRIMYPGEEHQFDGNYVLEIPLNKMNRKITDPTVIQRLIDNHKQKMMRNGGSLRRYQGNADPSTVVPTMPITGVPYALQTADDPYAWRNIPNAITSGNPYNAYNVRTNDGLINGTMQYFPEKGVLGTSFPVTEVAYALPQATVVGTLNRAGKYAKDFMTQNPDANAWGDSADPNSPVTEKFLGNLLGIGKTATNPYTGQDWGYYNRQTNYQNAKIDYIAEGLLKENPQGDRSRQEWLASFSPEEIAILQQSRKYSGEIAPNRWAEGAQGLANFFITRGGTRNLITGQPIQTVPNMFSGNLSEEEAKDAGLLAGLGMLSIPAQGVKGWITEGSGRGWAGASPMDYGQGRDVVTDLAGEIAFDPLNLMGTGFYAAPFKAAGKTVPYLRAATEMGTYGASKLLGKINPYLERNAGAFSKLDDIDPRMNFNLDPYVGAMDAEANRFGALDYKGAGPLASYKAFAESELPLPYLRRVAQNKGLNAQGLDRDAIVQGFKDRAIQEHVTNNLTPAERELVQDKLFENLTGKSVQSELAANPGLSRSDVFAQYGVYDINDFLNSSKSVDFNTAINQVLPNKMASFGDLNATIDNAANISKKGVSTIPAPMTPIQTPPDYIINTNGQVAKSASANGPFQSLIGQPGTTGSLEAGLVDLLSSNKTSGEEILAEMKRLMSEEGYAQGYGKEEINNMLDRFDANFREHLADHALNMQGVNGSKAVADGSFMKNTDIGRDALYHSLLPSVSNGSTNTPSGLNMIQELFHNANMENTGKGILKNWDKINGAGDNMLNHSMLESYFDDYLKNIPEADRAAAATKLSELAKGYGLDRALKQAINQYKNFTYQDGLNKVDDIIDATYGKKLNAKDLRDLKTAYGEVFQNHFNTWQSHGYDEAFSVNRALGDIVDPSGLNVAKHADIKNNKKILDALESGKASNYYKPSFNDKTSEYIRRGKSAARTKQFVTPGTREELATETGKIKQNFVDLKNPKQKTFKPSTDPGYPYYDQVTKSLFATSFKNSREMAMHVKNALENGFSNAKVGTVITGATNTSKDSYLIQMDYLMRIHKANPTATEPVFLGFQPMNSMSNLNKLGALDSEQMLNAINSKLNSIQHQTGINFSFEDKFPYIQNQQIMIPQWGLRKTEDVPIMIKKRKFGGQVEYGATPFIGYLPFTHYQLK